jgi:hypothetical protein
MYHNRRKAFPWVDNPEETRTSNHWGAHLRPDQLSNPLGFLCVPLIVVYVYVPLIIVYVCNACNFVGFSNPEDIRYMKNVSIAI